MKYAIGMTDNLQIKSTMKTIENAALYAIDILNCCQESPKGHSPLKAVQMAAQMFNVQTAHLLVFMRVNYSAFFPGGNSK